MELPTGYQTSLNFRVTGTLPPSHLDKTGRHLEVETQAGSPKAGSVSPGGAPSSSPGGGEHLIDQAQLAEAKDAQVAEGGLRGDRKQQCIDLLIDGCVQSFVDLLKVLQNQEMDVKEEIIEDPVGLPTHALTLEEVLKKDKKKEQKADIDILHLKETLEKAESSRRAKNFNSSIEYYKSIATYLESPQLGLVKDARYFYRRCIDVAADTGSATQLAKANLAMGICEESLKEWKSAMSFHEVALELATEANSLPIQTKAAYQLCNVYRVLAEQILEDTKKKDWSGREGERQRDIEVCADLFEKCVACSKLAKDIKLEGFNCHMLGKVKTLAGEYPEAIRLQNHYLEICREMGDGSGEAKARASLAEAHEATDNKEEAIQQLEILLQVAANTGELEAQAQACLNLGLLYSSYEKSIRMLEKHFDLARQLQNRELIDAARVILGMARGNGKLDLYMDVCRNDLPKLLEWKSRRAPLE